MQTLSKLEIPTNGQWLGEYYSNTIRQILDLNLLEQHSHAFHLAIHEATVKDQSCF